VRSRRRISSFLLASALAAWGVAAGCASFSGGSEDTTPDASDAPTADAPSVDAGADADTGATSDADASTNAPFCTDADFICDDFDDAPAGWPSPPWDNLPANDGRQTISLETDSVFSPPKAAEFDIIADAGSPYGAFLQAHADSGTGANGFRCEFRVHPVTVLANSSTDLFVINASNAGVPFYTASLSASPSRDLQYNESGTSGTAVAKATTTFRWVSILVTFGQPTTLLVDGAKITAPDAGPTPTGPANRIQIGAGAGYTGLSDSAVKVIFDDVRCAMF
jgi:hypothetical protein